METLNQIVRKHRRTANLTQAELAKLAGVGKTVVFDLESGKASIRFDTLRKILNVLNISMEFKSPLLAPTPLEMGQKFPPHEKDRDLSTG